MYLTVITLALDENDRYAGITGNADVDWDREAYEYVAAVNWRRGHDPLVLVQNRRQTRDQVLEVAVEADGAALGATRVLEEHANEQWIDLVHGTPAYTPDGRLVCSLNDMATDTNRLTMDGRPFTPAGWNVRTVLAVTDEDVLAVVQRAPEIAPEVPDAWADAAATESVFGDHDARSFDVVSIDYNGTITPVTTDPGQWTASRGERGIVVSGRDMRSARAQMRHILGKVVSYLRNEGNVRDTKKPFFIMVGMNPPHSPYRSLDDCEEEDFNLYRSQPLDSLLVRPNVDLKMKKAESVRYYFASVTGVDRAFGQILETLKDLGLDKNTVVIFASDHGETMCSQRTEDPKNSPYSESMNIPFLVRFPGKIQPRVDDLLLSSPDIMPTVLGLCGLGDSIPAEVQGRNFAPLFFDEKAEIVRPTGALYIQNLDGEKDENGLVQTYFPSSRGIKTAQYTLALYIDRNTKQLKKSLLFDDVKDPYQLHNLSLEENKEVVEQLYREMGAMLKEINDPWYTEKILSDRIPY